MASVYNLLLPVCQSTSIIIIVLFTGSAILERRMFRTMERKAEILLGRAWASPTLAWLHCKTRVYVCLSVWVWPYTKNWTNGNEGTRTCIWVRQARFDRRCVHSDESVAFSGSIVTSLLHSVDPSSRVCCIHDQWIHRHESVAFSGSIVTSLLHSVYPSSRVCCIQWIHCHESVAFREGGGHAFVHT